MTFKHWLNEMWFEHLSELESLGMKCDYDIKHYFNKYKWWLRREYRHQQGETK